MIENLLNLHCFEISGANVCVNKRKKKKKIYMNKCSDCHSHSMPLNVLDGFGVYVRCVYSHVCLYVYKVCKWVCFMSVYVCVICTYLYCCKSSFISCLCSNTDSLLNVQINIYSMQMYLPCQDTAQYLFASKNCINIRYTMAMTYGWDYEGKMIGLRWVLQFL